MSLVARPVHVGLALAFLWMGLVLSPPAHASSGIDRLETALASYRAMVAAGGWPMLPNGEILRPGDSDGRMPLLRRRLMLTGDLAMVGNGLLYDGDSVAAIRSFQARHGLAIDGQVGPRTLAALNVPASQRVAQLELNLARLRALPDLGAVHIRVNIAAALLEAVADGRTVLRMPVVVGDVRHQTPEFHSYITSILFNPPWNVPLSIAAKEMLPRLRRDPGYLAANDIHIVGRPDDPFGATIDWRKIPAAGFPYRLRQGPGLSNSLGRIKFEIPNPFDVYLHDTPGKAIFERPYRAASHGCIRVAQPRELASFVLGEVYWPRAAIDTAIAAGITHRIDVNPDIPVHIVYWTAFVAEDGTVNFRDDFYHRDRLASAPAPLAARPGGCSAAHLAETG